MAKLPEWVLKHQKKGTQAVQIGNGYYLYKIKSVWDPKRGRSRKVTEKYLGTIKPEGLRKSRHERLKESMKNISVKEFGATEFLLKTNDEIVEKLKEIYPFAWKEILVFSIFRILHNTPIKNLRMYYTDSFLSEKISGARCSPKTISSILKDIGREREKTKIFLRSFISGSDFALIDLTHVFSKSENIISATPGYNSKKEFLPQIHMAFLFSLDKHMPAYFRMLPGSIRDISSLVLTVKEADIRNAALIGDKGFYSEDNVKALDGKLQYILPLRRNSSLINYSVIQKGDRREFGGYFLFEKRAIWHYRYEPKDKFAGKTIFVFLDERLKAEEEKDYLSRIEKGDNEGIEKFFKNQYRMGTIAVITDVDCDAERAYTLLKSRVEIEMMFDAFKNVLNADRTYMQDDHQIEGWMFINFIALMFYYRLYRMLSDNSLLKNHSPKDVLLHLSRIYKLKINDRWVTSEIPKKSRTLLEKLEIPIT